MNLRSEPTTKNSNAIRLLDNYAFALVLGSVTNDEGTWYHISQGGTEGYIRGDYFHVLTLGELSSFLQSSEYMNANSNTAPGIVDADCQPILDRSEVYSGVYGRASVNFYAFNSNGNRGIACSLNNLQKIRDGEHLGGKSSAEEDFATEEEDDFLD